VTDDVTAEWSAGRQLLKLTLNHAVMMEPDLPWTSYRDLQLLILHHCCLLDASLLGLCKLQYLAIVDSEIGRRRQPQQLTLPSSLRVLQVLNSRWVGLTVVHGLQRHASN
jgi:hypothetical protein